MMCPCNRPSPSIAESLEVVSQDHLLGSQRSSESSPTTDTISVNYLLDGITRLPCLRIHLLILNRPFVQHKRNCVVSWYRGLAQAKLRSTISFQRG